MGTSGAEEEYENIRALDEFVGNILRPPPLIFPPLVAIALYTAWLVIDFERKWRK